MFREVAVLKRYAACLEWEGLQELELAMVGTPASQLVDLLCAGVNEASESAPPSSRDPSPSMEGWWGPSPLRQALKRANYAPTTAMSVVLKEEGGDIAGGTSSFRPLWGHCWLLRNLHPPDGTAEGTSGSLSYPSTSPSCQIFKWVNLGALAKCKYSGSVKSIHPAGTQWCPTAFRNIWESI